MTVQAEEQQRAEDQHDLADDGRRVPVGRIIHHRHRQTHLHGEDLARHGHHHEQHLDAEPEQQAEQQLLQGQHHHADAEGIQCRHVLEHGGDQQADDEGQKDADLGRDAAITKHRHHPEGCRDTNEGPPPLSQPGGQLGRTERQQGVHPMSPGIF